MKGVVMGKYRKFRMYVNGETIDLTDCNYGNAMKRYAAVPKGNDKTLVGIDWVGKEHPIIWTGKCR